MEKLYCTEHYKATVLPAFTLGISGVLGGVYSNGKPIPEAILPYAGDTEALCYQAPYIEPEKFIEEESIYCGVISPYFGHFLLDSLSRLWFAKKHPNIPIVWSKHPLPQEIKYKKWQKDILDLLSIKNTSIFLDNKPTEFKKLYIPTPGFIHGLSFHPDHASFLACYESQKPIKGKKVYISRKNIACGGYKNENIIEEFLKNNGWIIYKPELHSIVDQLHMFSSAEIVLGVESSAFHPLIFHTNITSKIFCLHRVGHPSYQLIPSVKKINYSTLTSILPEISYMHPAMRQYTCDTKKLFTYLKSTNFLEKNVSVDFVNNDYKKITNLTYSQCIKKYKNIPPTFSLNYYMGVYSLSKKKYAEGKIFLHKALLAPNISHLQRAEIFSSLAHIYEFNNDINQAIMYARKSVNEHNFLFSNHIYLTYLLRKKGDFAEAAVSAHAMMQQLPHSSEPYNDLALICENKGELDEAIVWACKAVEIEPLCFRKTVLAANLLFKKNHSDTSIELILKYATLIEDEQYSNVLSEHLNKSEKLRVAILVINTILEKNPKHFGSTILLAQLFQKKGDFNEAIALIMKTLTLGSYNGEPHAQLAFLYEARGEFNKAIEWLQQGIEIEPQHLGRKKMLCALLHKISCNDVCTAN